jgi:hypothetical protein
MATSYISVPLDYGFRRSERFGRRSSLQPLGRNSKGRGGARRGGALRYAPDAEIFLLWGLHSCAVWTKRRPDVRAARIVELTELLKAGRKQRPQ